jgi:hypothetical protein
VVVGLAGAIPELLGSVTGLLDVVPMRSDGSDSTAIGTDRLLVDGLVDDGLVSVVLVATTSVSVTGRLPIVGYSVLERVGNWLRVVLWLLISLGRALRATTSAQL